MNEKIRIDYRGVELDIEFEYQPYEPMVMYYPDGTGYPGADEDITGIISIEHNGVCFLDLLEEQEPEICEAILKQMNEVD